MMMACCAFGGRKPRPLITGRLPPKSGPPCDQHMVHRQRVLRCYGASGSAPLSCHHNRAKHWRLTPLRRRLIGNRSRQGFPGSAQRRHCPTADDWHAGRGGTSWRRLRTSNQLKSAERTQQRADSSARFSRDPHEYSRTRGPHSNCSKSHDGPSSAPELFARNCCRIDANLSSFLTGVSDSG